ncbi:MAG TPA: hypothetical protein VF679_04030, partial [Pedobacter sp.]
EDSNPFLKRCFQSYCGLALVFVKLSALLVSFSVFSLSVRPAFTDPLLGWESTGLFWPEVQLARSSVIAIRTGVIWFFISLKFVISQK